MYKKKSKKKACKKAICRRKVYCLENLEGYPNEWDGEISYTGDLYKNHVFITSFYEHPQEGGYYQNGEIKDYALYKEFLISVKKHIQDSGIDDDSIFDKGISELIISKFTRQRLGHL